MSVFHKLMLGKIKAFRDEFLDSSRSVFVDDNGNLNHSGEFGSYREEIVSRFLRSFIPHRLNISHGFLVNTEGVVSTQLDCIIYDESSSPMIETVNRQRFFPSEAVAAIGEIKSVLTAESLRQALHKLAEQKQKAERKMGRLQDVNPRYRSNEQIISFLICERFDFKKDPLDVIASAYDDLIADAMHRHNMVLSIEDGVMLYKDPLTSRYCLYPTRNDSLNDLRWHSALAENHFEHIARFCASIYEATSATKIFGVNMNYYVDVGVGKFSETKQLGLKAHRSINDPSDTKV